MERALTVKEKNTKKKYPDTKWFVYCNENPQGKLVGDCSFRAYCGAIGESWDYGVAEIMEEMIDSACDVDESAERLLRKHGFTKFAIKVEKGKKRFTGKTFCEMLNRDYGDKDLRVWISIGGHHVACIRKHEGLYKIHDTWDSSDGCINKAYTDIGKYFK